MEELGITFGTTDSHDPLGLIPWIAVSANLVYSDICLEKLNSEIPELGFRYTCLPFVARHTSVSWLTVRDENGAILSNRAAIVIILPGSPITTETRTQSRTQSGTRSPGGLLGQYQRSLGCSTCSATYDNVGLNTSSSAFPLVQVSSERGESNLTRTINPFNDRVDFITIDELVLLLERRVLAEMSSALGTMSKLGSTPIGYPWQRH